MSLTREEREAERRKAFALSRTIAAAVSPEVVARHKRALRLALDNLAPMFNLPMGAGFDTVPLHILDLQIAANTPGDSAGKFAQQLLTEVAKMLVVRVDSENTVGEVLADSIKHSDLYRSLL